MVKDSPVFEMWNRQWENQDVNPVIKRFSDSGFYTSMGYKGTMDSTKNPRLLTLQLSFATTTYRTLHKHSESLADEDNYQVPAGKTLFIYGWRWVGSSSQTTTIAQGNALDSASGAIIKFGPSRWVGLGTACTQAYFMPRMLSFASSKFINLLIGSTSSPPNSWVFYCIEQDN